MREVAREMAGKGNGRQGKWQAREMAREVLGSKGKLRVFFDYW